MDFKIFFNVILSLVLIVWGAKLGLTPFWVVVIICALIVLPSLIPFLNANQNYCRLMEFLYKHRRVLFIGALISALVSAPFAADYIFFGTLCFLAIAFMLTVGRLMASIFMEKISGGKENSEETKKNVFKEAVMFWAVLAIGIIIFAIGIVIKDIEANKKRDDPAKRQNTIWDIEPNR